MQCIWEGDIRKLECSAELCSIIENLAEYFIYTYRPWVLARLEHLIASNDKEKAKKAFKRHRKLNRSVNRAYKTLYQRWSGQSDTADELTDDSYGTSGNSDCNSASQDSLTDAGSSAYNTDAATTSDDEPDERLTSTISRREMSSLSPSPKAKSPYQTPSKARPAHPTPGSTPRASALNPKKPVAQPDYFSERPCEARSPNARGKGSGKN